MAIKVANNRSMASITALPSGVSGGAWTLISTTTASSSATLSITSGLDDTYDAYCFRFYNIHPASDNVLFQFNMSTDGGSNYNVTKTSTFFRSAHNEDDSVSTLGYSTTHDLAQSTGFQTISVDIGSDNDQGNSGYLYLFNPSSTTYVKHFIILMNTTNASEYSSDNFFAGYGNTTSAVDAVQFKMSSGNTDAGVIKLYGIS